MGKGIMYAGVLCYASLYDEKYHEIQNRVHIIILLLGCYQCNISASVLGALLIPLPFLFAALIDKNSMGGGDIKYMCANGFFLGVETGFFACIIGLSMAVIANMPRLKKGRMAEKKSVAMAPFLSIGCYIAYLLF